MTDYADIVRRLRKLQTLSSGLIWQDYPPPPINVEAADAIEALEKERDEALVRIENFHGVCAGWRRDWETVAAAAGENADIMVTSLAGRVQQMRARVAELEKERDDALAKVGRLTARGIEGLRWENDKLHSRVLELEGLIRSRCEHYCASDYIPRGRHAPECLVEEAGLGS